MFIMLKNSNTNSNKKNKEFYPGATNKKVNEPN